MIELSFLAFLFRLMNLGYEPVIATRVVAADLLLVRRLASAPGTYDGEACVRPTSSARLVVARVRLGRRRMLRYTWMLSPHRGTTEVDLAVQVESRGIAVRLVLLLGGRRWLQRRLDAMLAKLSRDASRAAEELEPEPAPAAWLHAA
jgi:hypothetical protein